MTQTAKRGKARTGSPAQTYIARIRNPAKRVYAETYRRYLLGRGTNGEPSVPTGLSQMGAQAVRIELHAFHQRKEL